MKSMVFRIAARFQDSLIQRIEAIPGWQRSNFLRSVHEQVQRGRALSPKQMAVIEKIEADTVKVPSGAIALKMPLRGNEVSKIVKELVEKGSSKVHDPGNLLETHRPLRDALLRELASHFWGRAETYAELNADEDDPATIRENNRLREACERAAQKMERAKIIVRNGVVTTDPDVQALSRSIRAV